MVKRRILDGTDAVEYLEGVGARCGWCPCLLVDVRRKKDERIMKRRVFGREGD